MHDIMMLAMAFASASEKEGGGGVGWGGMGRGGMGWDGVLTLIPFATNSATTSFWPLFTQHWLRYKRPLLIEKSWKGRISVAVQWLGNMNKIKCNIWNLKYNSRSDFCGSPVACGGREERCQTRWKIVVKQSLVFLFLPRIITIINDLKHQDDPIICSWRTSRLLWLPALPPPPRRSCPRPLLPLLRTLPQARPPVPGQEERWGVRLWRRRRRRRHWDFGGHCCHPLCPSPSHVRLLLLCPPPTAPHLQRGCGKLSPT